jgi:phage head maturation protease
MTREVKFVSLAEFKLLDEGPGSIEGYVTKFGDLDGVGDIILAGAYTDTIAQFLEGGFNADSHKWEFGNLIGYPSGAKEDGVGLFAKAKFHSTQPAQNARTVAQERRAAGLNVYTSIGYELAAEPIYVRSADYSTEIPKYSAPELVQQNLQKAQKFSQVRVIPKVHLFEWSLVPVPALNSAMVTSVKSLTDSLGTGIEYSDHILLLGTAIKEFADRTQARVEMRVKEGRVFSSANYSELIELYERLGKLLESAAPKPKETEQTEEAKALIAEVMLGIAIRDASKRGVPIR